MAARAQALRRLGDETFGDKMRRARHQSGLALRDVAELMSEYGVFVSHATVRRLEEYVVAPEDARRRALAFLVVLIYGFEPDDFGLDERDVPPRLDLKQFLAAAAGLRGQPRTSPACLTAGSGSPLAA